MYSHRSLLIRHRSGCKCIARRWSSKWSYSVQDGLKDSSSWFYTFTLAALHSLTWPQRATEVGSDTTYTVHVALNIKQVAGSGRRSDKIKVVYATRRGGPYVRKQAQHFPQKTTKKPHTNRCSQERNSLSPSLRRSGEERNRQKGQLGDYLSEAGPTHVPQQHFSCT